MRRISFLLCLCCLSGVAAAADDERARIAAERQTVTATFEAEERACANRFRVTACVDDVRARRREALAPLRERALQLDEEDRLQRALERRAAIEAKQAAAAARAPVGPAPQWRSRKPPLPASAAPHRQAAPDAAPKDPAAREVDAQERRREAQVRRQEAQAAQARIKKRLAERKAAGRKTDHLPVPAAASAAER